MKYSHKRIAYKKSEKPLRSVRGLSKERDVSWGYMDNGYLCLACLRRGVDKEEKCKNCKSESIIRLSSKCRIPRRTATRKHWKDFIKRHTITGRYFMDGLPEDFMRNI